MDRPRQTRKKMTDPRHSFPRAVATLTLLILAGCDAEPKAIRYGQDECAECRMTLVDRHYGVELITKKGKVFKFDDLTCLLTFQRRDPGRSGSAAQLVVIDFNRPNTFLGAAQAVFLYHNQLHTPMGSGLAAFANATELEAARGLLGGGGRILRWPEVLATP
jgi:copper chaperone NosL